MTSTHEHADLDALADALAAESDGDPVPEDLRSCPTCAPALDALRTALMAVDDDLASLPPVPLAPAAASLEPPAPVRTPTTVVPLDARRGRRWLLPAGGIAAAAVLVVGGGLLLTHGGTDSGSASRAAASPSSLAISHSGTPYTKASLAAAVPQLLKGTAEQSAGAVPGGKAPGPMAAINNDPLATLKTTSGLAACLAGLTGPGDESVPLAVDYATFDGQPALVVVLPSSRPSKLDVFVVGATCNQTEQDVLYYLHADRPTG